MTFKKTPQFFAGKNIAMKVPAHEFEKTVKFYKDIIRLPHVKSEEKSEGFKFGEITLWIDKVETVSHAELWLELESDNLKTSEEFLESSGIKRRDEIEKLPENFKGYWIASPCNIIHLITTNDEGK